MTRKAPGSGHVRTRTLKDGTQRFDVLVYKDGKKITLAGGLKSQAEADVYLLAYQQERAEHGLFVPLDSGVMTVRRLGELYLAAVNKRTAKTDRRRWNARVLPAEFIDWPLTQLSEQAVRRWIDTMARTEVQVGKAKGQRPSRGTLATALAVLRSALKYGVMHGHIDTNVAKRVTIGDSTMAAPKGTAQGDGYDYLHEAEVRRLLDAESLPQRQRTAFVLLAFTGARPMDLYRLTWDRVDVGGATVRYHSHKRDRDYTAHLLPQAHQVLRAWWIASGRPGEGLVFPGKGGAPHTDGYDWGWADSTGRLQWSNRLRDGSLQRGKAEEITVQPGWRSKIGIRRELPLYSLRHTAASHLLLGTPLFTGGRRWSMEEVASFLGHADMSTVRRYCVALGIASMRAVEESREMLAARDGKTRLV
jgi:integrase